MALHSSPVRLTPLLRCLLRQPPSNQGLTLIECLVAIIVIAITVATITPPIFLATATRVQARRGEQANQIAQGEVDRIRQLVERGAYNTAQLPADAGAVVAKDVAAAGGPVGGLVSPASCSTYPATLIGGNEVIPVDVDGDCTPEFAMQVYRSRSCTPASLAASDPNLPPYAFDLGVRVYTYKAGDTMGNLGTEQASLGLAAGPRDKGTTQKPLQVLYTRVARVGTGSSWECASP